jgi:hypothetical protein
MLGRTGPPSIGNGCSPNAKSLGGPSQARPASKDGSAPWTVATVDLLSAKGCVPSITSVPGPSIVLDVARTRARDR